MLKFIPTYKNVHSTHTQFAENITVTNRSNVGSEILVMISSGNDLSHVLCQAIIWTNADRFSREPLVTNSNEISNKISQYTFIKLHFKMMWFHEN